MSKIKVLFLAANPEGTSHLKLDEEIRSISEKIRASEYRDFLELISVWAVRPDDLLQSLNLYKPHIVHFSGHGSSNGEILLLNNEGQPKPVSIKALKYLFSAVKDNIRVVILNACYSKIQAESIIESIDCVIGMSDAIGDKAAINFAASFYSAIGFGRSVQESFQQGIASLLLEGIPEENTPQIIKKVGVDSSKIVLVQNLQLLTAHVVSSPKNPYVGLFKQCNSLDDLLGRGVRELEKVTQTDYNQILLSVPDGHANRLVVVAFAIPPRKQRYEVATFEGLIGKCFGSGKVLNIPNVSNDPNYFPAVSETKSELIMPIRSESTVIGVINSESEELAHYDPEICNQIESIASALGEMLPVFGWLSPAMKRLPRIHLLPSVDSQT